MSSVGSDADASPTPPAARKIPKKLEAHDHIRVDNYYWLNQRDDPAVINYLEAENSYASSLMAHTRELREQLFDEMKGRIPQTDSSAPVREGAFHYYDRIEEGRDYPVYARRRGSLAAEEEIILDVNELAAGHDFYSVDHEVNSAGDALAYAEDTLGRRVHTIRFKNLDGSRHSGGEESYPEAIDDASGSMAWAEDDRTLFYARRDPGTLRAYQVFRHILGRDPSEDVLVYQEDDEEFSCRVSKTKSKRYIVISSSHMNADEHRFLDARVPEGDPTLFLPRQRGHSHDIDHLGDRFYLRTNFGGDSNFKLALTPVDERSPDKWAVVVPHRSDVFLEDFELFDDYLVVAEREAGLTRLRVCEWGGEERRAVSGGRPAASEGRQAVSDGRMVAGAERQISFDEPAYKVSISDNPELETTKLRFEYESLSAPPAVYDYDMATRERTLLKEDEVLGGYDPDDFVVERLHAAVHGGAAVHDGSTGHDGSAGHDGSTVHDGGTKVPISLVYRRGLERDGTNPLLLYAYGSYGINTEPSFSSVRLSLLDRGFVYAIAHVRGGQELGRSWYDDGKMFKKMNTFTDYLEVAEFLVAEGYTSPDRLFAHGGSAGGLLMGAAVNLRPDLFRGVVANVPFVDVVSTMLDSSIPLTTFEFEEWGDPKEVESYRYMLSYSPYDQVTAQAYPNMLVTAGLHDSQVQYWEPAKWVAKLRALTTGHNRLLLKTHMDAGHGGGSGRDRRYEELAFEYAFILDLLGE